VSLLGSLQSSRGIHILATDSLQSGEIESELTPDMPMLTCGLRMPQDAMFRRRGGPFQTCGALNYISPNSAVTSRGGGVYTMSICVFTPAFLIGLAEIEEGPRLAGLDVLSSIQSDRLTEIGWAMFREAKAPGFAASLLAESFGLAIAVEIARCDGASNDGGFRRGGLAPWQMRRLEAYVDAHLSSDLTLDELARAVGISVRHLSRSFRQEKGLSVHRWIAERRLAEARRMLADTDLPVHLVGELSGFRSASAFAAAFRGATGYAAGEFRRLRAAT
jgi:AraC family transcriptional regulator